MLSAVLKKLFYPIKNSYISVLIFALGCFFYFAFSPFIPPANNIINILFFVLTGINFALAIYFGRNKTFFENLLIFLSYIILNNIKKESGLLYWSNPAYCYLSVLLPFNLCALFFIGKNIKISDRKNIFILLIFCIEYSLFEILTLHNINLFSFPAVFGLNNFSFYTFITAVTICFFKINRFDGRIYAADFFKILAIFLAFLLSFQLSAVCLFFALAALLDFVKTVFAVYSEKFYDPLTGTFNSNTYFLHSKDFPLKYCLCLIRIDNYEALIKNHGKRSTGKLIKMAVGQLADIPEEYRIYRLSADLFLLIFFNKNREDGFSTLEDIRRKIATSEFVLSRRKPLIKLTITSAITERRRSDFKVLTIISRVYNKLKSSLSQNVTLKA